VASDDFKGCLPEAVPESLGLDDPCVAGPTEDPSGDLSFLADAECHFEAAIGQGTDDLGGMPCPAASGVGGLGIETDAGDGAADLRRGKSRVLAECGRCGMPPWAGAEFADGPGGVNAEGGKFGDGLGVLKAEAFLVVLDGEAELVAHEIDVALDGLCGDFEFLGELAAIGKTVGHEPLVEAGHAGERGAGVTFLTRTGLLNNVPSPVAARRIWSRRLATVQSISFVPVHVPARMIPRGVGHWLSHGGRKKGES